MKKTAIILALLFVVALHSCKKSSTSTPITPVTTPGFTWTEDGGSNITADSAFFTMGTGGSTASYINAYKLGDPKKKMLEINLNNNIASTYSIPAQGDFILWNDVTFYGGTGGSVVVTLATGGKASGTFDITFTGGLYTHVKGSFTNIAIR